MVLEDLQLQSAPFRQLFEMHFDTLLLLFVPQPLPFPNLVGLVLVPYPKVGPLCFWLYAPLWTQFNHRVVVGDRVGLASSIQECVLLLVPKHANVG
jgi:hypothetical protein